MSTRPIIQSFQDNLNIFIDGYREQGITLSEAIGALEIVKLDLWFEQKESFDE